MNPLKLFPAKKPLFRRSWIILLALVLGLSACSTPSAPPPEVPGTLRVSVNVPPTWNMLLDDRISEAFTDRVRAVFHQAGFSRPVEELRYADDPSKTPYLLTINLIDWRINRVGSIDCTFSGTIQTPRGTRDLGLYSNTTMRWFGGVGRWGLARSFEEAAEGAIRELCDAVVKTEMLPGLDNRGTAKIPSTLKPTI